MEAKSHVLSREQIEDGLRRLGQKAVEHGKVIDLAIYGGSAIVLAFGFRVSTRDVDVVIHGDPTFVRKACVEIANELGWPADWLNDSVKGFVSGHEKLVPAGTYPSEAQPGLRVHVPTAEYLFAMKAMAMRVAGVEESRDIEDIKSLGKRIGIRTADEAIALVSAFYPDNLIAPKVHLGLQELFDTPPTNSKDDDDDTNTPPGSPPVSPSRHGPR